MKRHRSTSNKKDQTSKKRKPDGFLPRFKGEPKSRSETPLPSTTPTVETNNESEAEKLPANVAIAQERLNKASNKLKAKIPQEILESTNVEIQASADINSLADNIESALVAMMDLRNIQKSRQTRVRVLVMEWSKKTIPFVKTGLTIAKV